MYPHERSLVKRLADKPFALIGINSDSDKEKLKPRMEEEEITWRSFWNGPLGTSGPISERWNVHAWPTIYVLDSQGTIRYKGVRGKQMDVAVNTLLKEMGVEIDVEEASEEEPAKDKKADEARKEAKRTLEELEKSRASKRKSDEPAKPDKPTKPDEPATPEAAFRALKQEFDTARLDASKAYREAKTEEEKAEARKKTPNPAAYAKRFLELAQKHPKDPVAVDALIWVVQFVRGGADAEKALERLAADYADHEKVLRLVPLFARMPSPASERILRTALEKSSTREAQAQACLALAQLLKGRSDELAKDKDKAGSDKAANEAGQLFERVIADFGDVELFRRKQASGDDIVRYYREVAEGELFELRHLAVGMVAPDIEAEDLDGTPFKLTDYRGKVMMIDFWGDW